MSLWDACRELWVYRAEDRVSGHLIPGGYIPSIDLLLDQILEQHPEHAHVEQ